MHFFLALFLFFLQRFTRNGRWRAAGRWQWRYRTGTSASAAAAAGRARGVDLAPVPHLHSPPTTSALPCRGAGHEAAAHAGQPRIQVHPGFPGWVAQGGRVAGPGGRQGLKAAPAVGPGSLAPWVGALMDGCQGAPPAAGLQRRPQRLRPPAAASPPPHATAPAGYGPEESSTVFELVRGRGVRWRKRSSSARGTRPRGPGREQLQLERRTPPDARRARLRPPPCARVATSLSAPHCPPTHPPTTCSASRRTTTAGPSTARAAPTRRWPSPRR